MSWETILKASKDEVITSILYAPDKVMEEYKDDMNSFTTQVGKISRSLEDGKVPALVTQNKKVEEFTAKVKEIQELLKERRKKQKTSSIDAIFRKLIDRYVGITEPKEGENVNEFLEVVENISASSLPTRTTTIQRILAEKNYYDAVKDKAIEDDVAFYKVSEGATVTFNKQISDSLGIEFEEEGDKFVYKLPKTLTHKQAQRLLSKSSQGVLDGEVERTNLAYILRADKVKGGGSVGEDPSRKRVAEDFTDERAIGYLEFIAKYAKSKRNFNIFLPSKSSVTATNMDLIYDGIKPMPELLELLRNDSFDVKSYSGKASFDVSNLVFNELMAAKDKDGETDFIVGRNYNILIPLFEKDMVTLEDFRRVLDTDQNKLVDNLITRKQTEIAEASVEQIIRRKLAEEVKDWGKLSEEKQDEMVDKELNKDSIDKFFKGLEENSSWFKYYQTLNKNVLDISGLMMALVEIEEYFIGSKKLKNMIGDYIKSEKPTFEMRNEILDYAKSNYSKIRESYLDALKDKMADIANSSIKGAGMKAQPIDYISGRVD